MKDTDQIAAETWRKWCGKPRDRDVEAEFKNIIKAAIEKGWDEGWEAGYSSRPKCRAAHASEQVIDKAKAAYGLHDKPAQASEQEKL